MYICIFVCVCVCVCVCVYRCHVDSHPERPHRIAAMYQYLQDLGLARRCINISGTECTQEEVLRVHSLPHWQEVQGTNARAKEQGGGGQVGSDTSIMCYQCVANVLLMCC